MDRWIEESSLLPIKWTGLNGPPLTTLDVDAWLRNAESLLFNVAICLYIQSMEATTKNEYSIFFSLGFFENSLPPTPPMLGGQLMMLFSLLLDETNLKILVLSSCGLPPPPPPLSSEQLTVYTFTVCTDTSRCSVTPFSIWFLWGNHGRSLHSKHGSFLLHATSEVKLPEFCCAPCELDDLRGSKASEQWARCLWVWLVINVMLCTLALFVPGKAVFLAAMFCCSFFSRQ